jgi:simple sugar transport system permease protein
MAVNSDLRKPRPSLFSKLKSRRFDSQTLLLLGVFIAIFAFFTIVNSRFVAGASLKSMAFQLPEIGILSLAMLLPTIVGGIDLSVNSVSNLAAVLCGIFLTKILPANILAGNPTLYVILALGLALLIGTICGMLNGFLVGHIGIPPILATLATYTLFTGIATGLTGGKTVTGFPDQIGAIGAGTLFGIPIPFVIFIALTILVYVILYRTTFGFKVRMLGSNPTAAKFSGLKNNAILMRLYIISGILSSIAGILVMSRTMSAAYEYGTTTYVMLAILITVLADIVPGFGSVLNIFISVLILQVLSTGFHLILAGMTGSSFFKDFFWGVLMIFIFIFNYMLHRKETRE